MKRKNKMIGMYVNVVEVFLALLMTTVVITGMLTGCGKRKVNETEDFAVSITDVAPNTTVTTATITVEPTTTTTAMPTTTTTTTTAKPVTTTTKTTAKAFIETTTANRTTKVTIMQRPQNTTNPLCAEKSVRSRYNLWKAKINTERHRIATPECICKDFRIAMDEYKELLKRVLECKCEFCGEHDCPGMHYDIDTNGELCGALLYEWECPIYASQTHYCPWCGKILISEEEAILGKYDDNKYCPGSLAHSTVG